MFTNVLQHSQKRKEREKKELLVSALLTFVASLEDCSDNKTCKVFQKDNRPLIAQEDWQRIIAFLVQIKDKDFHIHAVSDGYDSETEGSPYVKSIPLASDFLLGNHMELEFSISKEALAAKIDALFPANEFSAIYERHLSNIKTFSLQG